MTVKFGPLYEKIKFLKCPRAPPLCSVTNVEMDVLSIHYHPEFHPGNLYNDIAVVKLDGVVDF